MSKRKLSLDEIVKQNRAKVPYTAEGPRFTRAPSERIVPRYDDPVSLAVIMAAVLPDSTPAPEPTVTHHTPSHDSSSTSSWDSGSSSTSSDSSGSAGGSDSSGSAGGSEGGSW